MKDIKEIADQVHKEVLSAFTYKTDMEMHGVNEHWQFPTDITDIKDDCDGFAIACRIKLREQGLDTRLVVCKCENDEMHLVCATGNYILDNRQAFVKTKRDLERIGYRFLFVSGLEPGDPWHKLNN